MTVLRGDGEGPTVYLIAGIHGDEEAGWLAAKRLKDMELPAGTLYILSPANAYGAEKKTRKTRDGRDLNRHFPGSADGFTADRIAAAIWSDIEEKGPDLVLDLHEAEAGEEGRDSLGNSLICQSLDGIGDLVLALLEDTDMILYGSPPEGSLNRTVTEGLGIPVITIETDRSEPLEKRIRTHMELVNRILEYWNDEEKAKGGL